jgi:hypothetical protein
MKGALHGRCSTYGPSSGNLMDTSKMKVYGSTKLKKMLLLIINMKHNRRRTTDVQTAKF